MSSDKEPSASADGDDAEESPPTDTRTTPRRFEPITRDADDDEGTNATGTMRRNRPPHIATNTGNPNYGMLFGFGEKLSPKV